MRYYDRYWNETADFLKLHWREGESILGPSEFMTDFPAIQGLEASFHVEVPSLAWVALHKGMLDEVAHRFLLGIERRHRLVFANEVFVVFADRQDVPAIERPCRHYSSFEEKLLGHEDKRPPRVRSSAVLSLVRRCRPLRRIDARRRLRRGGASAPHRFHYFGEFGFLNFHVLGGLQSLFREMPATRLEILTFPHYGELLEGLFPDNIRFRSISYDFVEAMRAGHRTRDPELMRRAERTGHCVSLHKLFKSWAPDGIVSKDQYYINVRSPLEHPLPAGAAKRFVSIFPRNRTNMAFKNLTPAEWGDIVCVVDGHCPYPIVVHGVAAESLDLPRNDRFVFPRSPLEQIAYLNHSACFLSPDSGMVQFAMNCRCDTLVLGGCQMFSTFLNYNPFQCRLCMTPRETKDLPRQVESFLKRSMDMRRMAS